MNINKNTNFGTHNTSKRTGSIKYLVIHYVGATGDAKANINYYNQKTSKSASADFYVGHNGDVWQYNPDPKSRYCWAVGGSKQSSSGGSLYKVATNANTIHIEMCVKFSGNGSKYANSPGWYITDATYNSTVELAKYLMNLYGISASNVIRHFDVNGKACPGVVGWNSLSGSETKWKAFKEAISGGGSSSSGSSASTLPVSYRIRKSWTDTKSQVGAYSNLENAKKACDAAGSEYKVFDNSGNIVYPVTTVSPAPSQSNSNYPAVPFSVQVLVSDLNYRSEPSMNGKVKGTTGKGTFTINQVSGEWGKLLSGVGWIYLANKSYVKIGSTVSAPASVAPTTTSSSYKVKVTTNALNVRSGPGTSYRVTGCIRDKGVYNITETKNGWGKLKSNLGWISLQYTKKV